MRKRRVTPIGAAFAALVLLVLLFVLRGALHRPARVVLPQESSSSDASDADPRCLDGQNLIDGLSRKQTRPFGAHFIKQRRVQLMIQKRTNF